MQVLLEGLQERSRSKTMDELRSIIIVDHHEAVKVGDLQKELGGAFHSRAQVQC